MKKVRYKNWFGGIMAVLTVLCLMSCGGQIAEKKNNDAMQIVWDDFEKLPDSEDNTLIFTPQWTAQAQFAGYYVAKELGLYDKIGLDVKIEHPSVTYSALDRIRDNQSHATTLQLVQAMEIIDNGIPMVNILQTSMNNGLAIVSKTGNNPLDQKGARVGIWSAGFDQLPICMNIKDELGFEWIRIASNVNLFISGDLDAITVMTYNEYYQLVQAGMELSEQNVFRFCDSDYNIQEDGVYVTRDYYLNHTKQAIAFAKASRKGWEWAAEHQDEALDIVMKYVEEGHVATNRTLQKLMLKEIIRLQCDQTTGKQEFTLKKEMVERAGQLLHECGIMANEISYEEMIP
ncbi:MAG: ABC transporter substrate-binding protein [Bacteroidaceae bacterium]|nr:ABC transporter substrate-binding protein [Bacteroidaceae bacterium]